MTSNTEPSLGPGQRFRQWVRRLLGRTHFDEIRALLEQQRELQAAQDRAREQSDERTRTALASLGDDQQELRQRVGDASAIAAVSDAVANLSDVVKGVSDELRRASSEELTRIQSDLETRIASLESKVLESVQGVDGMIENRIAWLHDRFVRDLAERMLGEIPARVDEAIEHQRHWLRAELQQHADAAMQAGQLASERDALQHELEGARAAATAASEKLEASERTIDTLRRWKETAQLDLARLRRDRDRDLWTARTTSDPDHASRPTPPDDESEGTSH